MNTPKPEISRKQAWCKLAVLIAEGLPEPQTISFNPLSKTSISITVDTLSAFDAWRSALGLGVVHQPCLSNERDVWLHDAWDYWNGWHARVSTTLPADADGPTAEDMSAVRVAAEAGA